MSKFAVIKTGGKQYRVSEGDVIEVEKIEGEPKTKVSFDEVLLISDKDVVLGNPFIENSIVEAEIIEQTKGEKINGFKYKAKSRYRRRWGHRQKLTKVEIKKIK